MKIKYYSYFLNDVFLHKTLINYSSSDIFYFSGNPILYSKMAVEELGGR